MTWVIGATSQRRRWASSASPNEIAKPMRQRDHREEHVLEERVHVAVEVVDDPVGAEAVVGHAAGVLGRAVAELDLGERQAHVTPRPAASRRRCGTSLGVGLERVADDLDREHPGDAAVARPPPGRTGSRSGAGRRARRAARRRARRSARRCERRSSVTRSPASAALAEPAERLAVGVHQQRVGQVGVGDLGARLGHRLAHAHERRLPQVDVAHALERQALERAVGAHEVLHEPAVGVHQQLGRAARTGRACRPSAAPRSGRPS